MSFTSSRPSLSRSDKSAIIWTPSRRAFITCEGNAALVVVDLNTARILATDTVGDVPDVLAFDAGWQRLYVASRAGWWRYSTLVEIR